MNDKIKYLSSLTKIINESMLLHDVVCS